MKANELMIGDWVMYNRNVFNEDEYKPSVDCEPAQIESGEDIDLAIEGCFDPIPLTGEILKANGFLESIEEGTYYFPQYVDINQMGYAIETNDGEAFFITGHELIVFDYVHELQQALRLCGLNELADNFKLE